MNIEKIYKEEDFDDVCRVDYLLVSKEHRNMGVGGRDVHAMLQKMVKELVGLGKIEREKPRF